MKAKKILLDVAREVGNALLDLNMAHGRALELRDANLDRARLKTLLSKFRNMERQAMGLEDCIRRAMSEIEG